MIWYAWKVWRIAWALNRGGVLYEGDGTWIPVLWTRLMFRVSSNKGVTGVTTNGRNVQ